MNRNKIGLMLASGLIIALLQGCGGQAQAGGAANNAAPGSAAASGVNLAETGNGQANGNGASGYGQAFASMKFGKIKSISKDKITVYEAQMPAGRQRGGQDGQSGGTGGAAGSGGRGWNGAPPSGAPRGGGQGGQYQTPGAKGGAAQGAGSRQRGSGGVAGSGDQQNRPQRTGPAFSQDTADITVTSATKIITVDFTNGSRTETAKSISDLKEGDIITYQLKDGSSEAETIQIGMGGGMIGGARGGQPGAGQGQGSGDAAQAGSGK